MAARQWASQELVRKRTKKVPYSAIGLVEILEQDGAYDAIVKVRNVAGVVRLIVRARGRIPESWAMAVLFNNERIDGIDWENVVRDHRGAKFNCKGWHRHVWKPNGSDRHKECLPKFRPTSREDFVVEGFKILKVTLGKGRRDERQLRFN
jgi:hypothetical protein